MNEPLDFDEVIEEYCSRYGKDVLETKKQAIVLFNKLLSVGLMEITNKEGGRK